MVSFNFPCSWLLAMFIYHRICFCSTVVFLVYSYNSFSLDKKSCFLIVYDVLRNTCKGEFYSWNIIGCSKFLCQKSKKKTFFFPLLIGCIHKNFNSIRGIYSTVICCFCYFKLYNFVYIFSSDVSYFCFLNYFTNCSLWTLMHGVLGCILIASQF